MVILNRKLLFISVLVLFVSCGNTETGLPKAEDYRQDDPAVVSLLQDIRHVQPTGQLHSVMVVKGGEKVLEYYDVPYGPDFLHICWSISKNFTATAIGFAVQEKLLTIEDKLIEHLKPEQLPEHIGDTLASLTIYDLLIMSSGFKLDPVGDTGSGVLLESTKYVLESGFKFVPGEQYFYNSHDTYMLSVVLTNVTGQTVAEYLEPRLFKPLGITKYHWDESAEGYSMGGWGLYLSTESLAKMGLFMLNKGKWNGKQILNPEWLEAMTGPQIMQYQNLGWTQEMIDSVANSDNHAGYGYQTKLNARGGFRLTGANGQRVIVLPKENVVIVVTGHLSMSRDNTEIAWEHFKEFLE